MQTVKHSKKVATMIGAYQRKTNIPTIVRLFSGNCALFFVATFASYSHSINRRIVSSEKFNFNPFKAQTELSGRGKGNSGAIKNNTHSNTYKSNMLNYKRPLWSCNETFSYSFVALRVENCTTLISLATVFFLIHSLCLLFCQLLFVIREIRFLHLTAFRKGTKSILT